MPIAYQQSTCAKRYQCRKAKWALTQLTLHSWRHFGWWLLHNAIAHPLLAIPNVVGLWAHDYTSHKLNLRYQRDGGFQRSTPPVVARWGWWILHNVLAHILIGIAPCAVTFAFHDYSAAQMQVEDWV
jgi:hypothetical protein